MPTLEDVWSFLKRKGVVIKIIDILAAIMMMIVLSLFKSDPIVDFIGLLVFVLIIIFIIIMPIKNYDE
jgi:uncharacterized membrane protein